MSKLTWNEYFMGVVKMASLRSEDPNTKVGAVIVNKRNRIIGVGYNGMPSGHDFTWERKAEKAIDTKYPYVIHAEINAILNVEQPIEDAKIYVTLFPCSNCAKVLVQAGIKEVFYIDDKYKGIEDNKISKYILDKTGVKYTQLVEKFNTQK